jgi:hypothetical protein
LLAPAHHRTVIIALCLISRFAKSMIRHPLSLALPLLFLATGCDLGGQYEKKFQSTLQNSAKQAVFADNLHVQYTEVMDSAKQPVGVKLRLPKIFDSSSKVITQSMIPLPANMQGSTLGYVRQVDDPSGKKLAYTVVITAMPKPDQKAAAPVDLSKALATFLPGAKPEDVSFNSPSGQSVTLKRVRTDVALPDAVAKAAKVSGDMRTDLYQVDAGSNLVMIVWMTPKSMSATLDPAYEASMGTLEITAAPAAPPTGGKAG